MPRWLLALAVLAGPAAAVECRETRHEGTLYSLCQVDAAREDLRLFLTDPETGRPLGSFSNVAGRLAERGLRLEFAMNGGMYHTDRRPVGLYVEAGREITPLVEGRGTGNFSLRPNGVLCIQPGRARVIETERFRRTGPDCRYATQSGPMLVIDGDLHPRFLPDSDSRYVRNGVGTSADGRRAWFAMSNTPVTFHEFGRFFRDRLGTPQALYLDGSISRLYAPGLGRRDGGFPMGPIIGVVAPAP
jgi:uncharacterized protein YigE (DUF2233 family)